MKSKILAIAFLTLAVAAFTTVAWADGLTDPELLYVNSGCGASCPLLYNGGTEVTSIPTNSLYVFLNGTSKTTLSNPVLLLIGIPNDPGTSSAPGISSLSTGTGVLGGTNIYSGTWNTSTGYAGSFTTGVAYDLAGLSPGGSPSESFGNWTGADAFLNGITATNFGIYVYSLNTTVTGGNTPGVEVNFAGNLPVGTFAIAYGCDSLDPAGTNCSSVGNTYSTPFTMSGNVLRTPEPGALALLGSGILGLFGVRRKVRG